MHSFHFILFYLLNVVTISLCPVQCRCTNDTFQCKVCLSKYHRFYYSQNQCQCQDTFIEKQPLAEYCCPMHCVGCSIYGCANCKNGWQLRKYSNEYYKCQCKANYYYNLTMKDCVCKSSTTPSNYYYTNTTGCQVCPIGCTCTLQGCIRCTSESFRVIEKTVYGQFICNCASQFQQAGNGTCICPQGCDCIGSTVIFTNNTKWEQVNNQLLCQDPYIKVNGSCICFNLYTPASITQDNQCVCLSKLMPTQYYQDKNGCYRCPNRCNCNFQGCFVCASDTNRIIIDYTCPCRQNYTQIMQSYLCVCIQPYYISNSGCICLSNFSPTLYYYDFDTRNCIVCPIGCNCDKKGCNNCPNNNRIIVLNKKNINTCYCKLLFIEVDGICVCPLPYIYQNGDCVCANSTASTQVYYNNDIKSCSLCPFNCVCNSSGCVSCANTAYRNITNQSGQFSCSCMVTFIVNKFGNCVCPFTSSLNSINNLCQCAEPYYLDNTTNTCRCKSDTNPSYYYSQSTKCYPCPVDCLCNQSGCIQCGPNTLRYIVWLNISYSVCPCMQNSILQDNKCNRCLNNQYYYYQSCVSCSINCVTCNILGCLSCHQNMSLVNYSCVCQNSSFINLNGICTCPQTQYMNNSSCYNCPLYCASCIFKNTLQCLSCAINHNRLDSPKKNCPCLLNYVESYPFQRYCCDRACLSCNSSGCTACSYFAYRFLNTSTNLNTCSCLPSFIEQNDTIVCSCPQMTYLYKQKCVSCPVYCKNCRYDATINQTYCSSCRENTNRNSSSNKCTCLEGFIESYPQMQLCSPIYCLYPGRTCTQCIENMVSVNNFTKCVCKQGYFLNIEGICILCNLKGCLSCLSASLCTSCDIEENYYLTIVGCMQVNKKLQYIISSFIISGLLLQILINKNITGYRMAKLQIILFQTYNSINEQSKFIHNKTFDIISNKLIAPNLLYVLCKNFKQYQFQVLINVNLYLAPQSSNFTQDQLHIQQNIYMPLVLGSDLTNYATNSIFQLQDVTILLLMIFSGIVYMRGYKHNQIVFYMQNLFFQTMGIFVINSKIILMNVHYQMTYLGGVLRPLNPFKSLVAQQYLQRSPGNFGTVTGDGNIYRNAGTAIFVFLLGILLCSCLRIYYTYLDQYKKRRYNQLKKKIYRFIEFFYKLTMYPIIFYSVLTLVNWNYTIVLFDAPKRKLASRFISFFSLSSYTAITIYQVFFQQISKMNKIQNLNEYICNILASLIICLTIFDSKIMLLSLVYFIKSVVYVYSRRCYVKDFQNITYFRLVIMIFQMLTVISIYLQKQSIYIFSLITTIVSHVIHPILLIKNYQRKCLIQRGKPIKIASQTCASERITID